MERSINSLSKKSKKKIKIRIKNIKRTNTKISLVNKITIQSKNIKEIENMISINRRNMVQENGKRIMNGRKIKNHMIKRKLKDNNSKYKNLKYKKSLKEQFSKLK